MHQTPETVIIVDGIVLRATIVPERERPGLPAEAAGEFRTCQVVEEIVEDWCTFRCSHVLEADGVTAVHIERLAPGFRMGPDDGVLGDIFRLCVGSRVSTQPIFSGSGRVGL